MEKIKHIEITNFKSIKHLEVNDCNKINVFIGKPNAGKSNILEALGLFQILQLGDIDLREFFRIEAYRNLFHFNQQNQKLIVDLDFEKIELENKNDSLKVFSSSKTMFFKTEIPASEFHPDAMKNGVEASENYDEVERLSIKNYLFKGKKQNSRYTFFNELSQYGENLGQIVYQNQELRSFIKNHLESENLKIVVKSGNYELAIQKELEDGTVFELPYELIADTLQRLIFYKAAIISNHNAVLLFEEPEAHCFEPYILEFTNGVKYDENDNQFFIVTHSDYIVKEFLRDEESKENTNIYLVNNVDGETKVKLLDKKNNEDVFEFGMNIFFNFESLWETN
ncbi:AAA family ATPase [Flavobacterium sp. SUN046]|uniref:AAA family ATPase n=1 Tax=Flavobacterium sp. SUN046 TaxID=3002440 RepID=UPI002DB90640|nr:AAA family ATPase [Flavobacterium sp. SUN046]MEC4048051.1 AAA family ATPase [Flavobacterium sp. SUN046]